MSKETLLLDLQSKDWTISVKAANELLDYPDEEVVLALMDALTQKQDLWLAHAAAKTLLGFASPISVPALASVLTSTSLEQELKETADRLTASKDYRGLIALGEHHGGDILALKTTVAKALVKIGTPEALAALDAATRVEDPYHLTAKAIKTASRNTP